MRIFTSASYEIYFRKLFSKKPLFLEKKFYGFTKLNTPLLYWAADPFIVELNGEVFVYAELYHRFFNVGRIAYIKLGENNKWKFLTGFKHHFSFPNPLIFDGKLYIVPETSSQNFVGIFNGFNFSEYKVIIKDFPGVDSVFNIASKKMLTYNQKTYELFTYSLDVENNETKFLEVIKDPNKQFRPAGNIFKYNNELIFPSQNCINYYGESINFNKLKKNKIIKFNSLTINEINSGLKLKCGGCHTYNLSQNYEIIDVQFFKFNIVSFFGKFVLLLKLLLKKK